MRSDASKIRVKVSNIHHLSEVAQSCPTPWTIAHQAPPSMGLSRQEYWSGLPFPSPGDLPDPGIEPRSPALQANALTSEPPSKLPFTTLGVFIYFAKILNTYTKHSLLWRHYYIIIDIYLPSCGPFYLITYIQSQISPLLFLAPETRELLKQTPRTLSEDHVPARKRLKPTSSPE